MALEPMYPGVPYSPSAILTQDIGPTDTIVPVDDPDVFPPGPNLAVIGSDETAETIRYASVEDGLLLGCERGVEGTARIWLSGTLVARNWTNQDYQALIDNINKVDASAIQGVKVNGTALTPDANQVVDAEIPHWRKQHRCGRRRFIP